MESLRKSIDNRKNNMISNELIKFFRENKSYIEEDNWEGFYNAAENTLVGELGPISDILYAANINPLLYMEGIRYGMFFESKLKTVHIPDNIRYIDSYAFSCSHLTSVHIPDLVEAIGSNAFSACSDLREVYIGKGVKDVRESAFLGCRRDCIFRYGGTKEEFSNINFRPQLPVQSIICTDGLYIL